ncbi:MAG: hypothetical protein ACAH35_04885 [Candidatus Paceibacterota bacterium]
MKNKSKLTALVAVLTLIAIFALGCGNASMKELNPAGGQVTLYSAGGDIIKTYQTDGKPEMHQGGHLYLKDRETGKFIIIYGTYAFEER